MSYHDYRPQVKPSRSWDHKNHLRITKFQIYKANKISKLRNDKMKKFCITIIDLRPSQPVCKIKRIIYELQKIKCKRQIKFQKNF